MGGRGSGSGGGGGRSVVGMIDSTANPAFNDYVKEYQNRTEAQEKNWQYHLQRGSLDKEEVSELKRNSARNFTNGKTFYVEDEKGIRRVKGATFEYDGQKMGAFMIGDNHFAVSLKNPKNYVHLERLGMDRDFSGNYHLKNISEAASIISVGDSKK